MILFLPAAIERRSAEFVKAGSCLRSDKNP